MAFGNMSYFKLQPYFSYHGMQYLLFALMTWPVESPDISIRALPIFDLRVCHHYLVWEPVLKTSKHVLSFLQ